MITDEWIAEALTEDAVVVELLFRLKQSSESFASQPAKLPPLPPFQWGHRQPRSKPATAKKEREWTRCSPTTPLSWSFGGSGATSPSDGCDESSRPSDLSSGDKSKCIFTNEATGTATTTKLLRRKKELASLRVTLKEQKARSESLKRLKLDLHLAFKTAATSEEVEAANSIQINLEEASTLNQVEKQVETRERSFILPDLNMVPTEEDSSCEIFCGLS